MNREGADYLTDAALNSRGNVITTSSDIIWDLSPPSRLYLCDKGLDFNETTLKCSSKVSPYSGSRKIPKIVGPSGITISGSGWYMIEFWV